MTDYKAILNDKKQQRENTLDELRNESEKLQDELRSAEAAARSAAEAGNEKEFITQKNRAEYANIRLSAILQRITEAEAAPLLSKQEIREIAKEIDGIYKTLLQKMQEQYRADYTTMQQNYNNTAAAIDRLKAEYESIKGLLNDDPGLSIGYSPVIGDYIKKGGLIK